MGNGQCFLKEDYQAERDDETGEAIITFKAHNADDPFPEEGDWKRA